MYISNLRMENNKVLPALNPNLKWNASLYRDGIMLIPENVKNETNILNVHPLLDPTVQGLSRRASLPTVYHQAGHMLDFHLNSITSFAITIIKSLLFIIRHNNNVLWSVYLNTIIISYAVKIPTHLLNL